MNQKREGYCECCERLGLDISEHHLIPKTTHKNKRIQKMFSRDEMVHRKSDVCQPCHKAFHTFFTEKELALRYNTLEKLNAHPAVQKHLKWVKKQKPGFRMTGKRMGQKVKQYA
jgi:hypothetical protein